MAGSGTTINSVTFNPLKTTFTVNNNEYENAGSITISCSGSPDPSVYVSSIKSSDTSIAEVILDDSSRAVSGSNVTTDFRVKPNSAGTVTLTATAFDNANLRNVTGTLEITVTAGAVDDESYLNKSGLTHFWENIDNVKQDKLKAGTNITISADNTISADLETELSQYVTAEDIASTSALTPPVQTNMIANGAVTSDKINWKTMPVRYTCASTDNKPTVNMTVNLPPQKASSAYTLYLSTVGGSFSPTEHVVFFRTSGTNVLDATPGKLSSTGQNITSISLSDYNAANHTVQLSVTYDGKVYWQLFVRAYNRGGTY